MAHPYPHPVRPYPHHTPRHVHFIAMLLLAAVVLIVTLSVRDHKPPPQPHLDNTPMTAPR